MQSIAILKTRWYFRVLHDFLVSLAPKFAELVASDERRKKAIVQTPEEIKTIRVLDMDSPLANVYNDDFDAEWCCRFALLDFSHLFKINANVSSHAFTSILSLSIVF